MERHASLTGDSVRFNTEARRAWLAFATSPQATWRGNFRELSASVTRMATFATSGRITLDAVEDEINRLRYNWQESRPSALTALLGAEAENTRSLRPYATGTRYRYLPPGKVAFRCRTLNCLTFRARAKPASMTRIGYANTWRVLV